MLGRLQLQDFGPQGKTLKELDLEFRSLTLFAGDNGVGKSLLFKAAWVMGMGLNTYKVALATYPTQADKLFKENMDVILETTFLEAEEIQGVIQISDKDQEIYNFMIQIKDGKMINFDFDIFDTEAFSLGTIEQISYNSKEARTFNQYDTYIKLKKRFNFEMIKGNDAILEMAEFYRLYDMMWFEQVQSKIKKLAAGEDNLDEKMKSWNEAFKSRDRGAKNSEMPETDQFIFAKDTVFIEDMGNLKRLSTYSAGIQSLVMLTFFSR